MLGARKHKLFLLLVVCLQLGSRDANGQWRGYRISGGLGTGFNYSHSSGGDESTWSWSRSDSYSLGLDGSILDPRLATFSINGALSTSESRSSQTRGSADSRALSFGGNLSLLSQTRYPLNLFLSHSHFGAGVDTDVLSFGGSWSIAHRALPTIFLNFNRTNVQSSGLTKAEANFTSGTLRVAKQLESSDLAADFGVQNAADNVAGTSTTRYFGSFSDITRWSPATTLRFGGNFFQQEGTLAVGGNFSLINQPDPTLSRAIELGIHNTSGKDQESTSLGGSGSISKAFQPYPTLSVSPFTAVSFSRGFASQGSGDSTSFNWSLGSSLVSSYFRPVLATARYGLALSYADRETEGSDFGTTQQFQIGLQSTTLQPYYVRGDYSLLLERTQTERNRHDASLWAGGPIGPTMSFQSFARLSKEEATHVSQKTRSSVKGTIFGFGGTVDYRGIERLGAALSGSVSISDNETFTAWFTQLRADLSYSWNLLRIGVNGTRETESLREVTRYKAETRLSYLFGRSTINVMYGFNSVSFLDGGGRGHSVSISVFRPFSFAF